MASIITRLKQNQILQLISEGKRLDGRDLKEYREIKVEQGIIQRAEGSARVLLGRTEVIAGVKVEIGKPFSDRPNDGVLTVNVELAPLASPEFEPGPPREAAIELARVVDRGIRESKAIDLEKLCIEPGKKVFVIFVDIYALNHDGNLLDASALAALAALNNTKIFDYEIEGDEVKIKPGYKPLRLNKQPITVTQGKINDQLIVDPSLPEEQVIDARFTVTIDDKQNICAIQKGKGGTFTQKEALSIVKLAMEKAEEIRKHLTR